MYSFSSCPSSRLPRRSLLWLLRASAGSAVSFYTAKSNIRLSLRIFWEDPGLGEANPRLYCASTLHSLLNSEDNSNSSEESLSCNHNQLVERIKYLNQVHARVPGEYGIQISVHAYRRFSNWYIITALTTLQCHYCILFHFMLQVTGIVGRADVLACIFFLLSFLAYHGWVRFKYSIFSTLCIPESVDLFFSKIHKRYEYTNTFDVRFRCICFSLLK